MLKKSIMCLAALAVVALGATSCKKDVNNEENGVQFRAIMETGSAKTELSGTNVNWIAGDEVMIYGTEQSGVYTATPDAENATAATLTKVGQPAQGTPYTAIYPASAAVNATTVTLPAVQQSEGGNLANTFPMYAQSTTTTLNFMNLCGVLKIHLQQADVTISKIVVTTNESQPISGTFTIDNSGEAPAIACASDGSNTVTLLCNEPVSIANGVDFCIAMPAGSYENLQVEIYRYDNAKRVKSAPANATIDILRSKYSVLTIATDFAPDNCIDGLFTVATNNNTGEGTPTKRVYFSKGNLMHNGTQFQFAEHQYDYGSYFSLSNGTTSNYGLSTTAEDYPKQTSVDFFVDWGNAVTSTEGTGWYTLTESEMGILVSRRTYLNGVGSDAKHACVKVVDAQHVVHYGVLFFPDSYNYGCWPAEAGAEPQDPYRHYAIANTSVTWAGAPQYTYEQFQVLEANGYAFLPFAGHYKNNRARESDLEYVDGVGYYWLRPVDGDGTTTWWSRKWSQFHLGVISGTTYSNGATYKPSGQPTGGYPSEKMSVRLVKEAPAAN